ncbi:dynactin-like protein subunit 2 [Westerdykella ornata]|uniref:Dynactin-like protein subunit 2 n=1 Tax=Westerdykella ornata TaxID=318751 RepID=A0A6A6JND7_WESOR|nr:dynactin-like protein subunit 2 [Westerdykella ornata]KAF2278131.1 dynactin-like protein subunit 2 [Westerdykella ornata]
MAEASKPKYENLPGIDTSPDVYETPDLDAETSTIQASTAVSESSGHPSDDDEDESAIRHQRLQPDVARNRFRPSRVDAQGVDFSDNISAQRRSYKTSTRRRRRGEMLGDASGEDGEGEEEEESFSRRLMRLRHELTELEDEYRARVESGDKSKIEEQDPKEVLEMISDKVDMIYARRRGGVRGAEALLKRTMERFDGYTAFGPSERIGKAIRELPPLPGSQVQKNQLDFVLEQAADFDKRLEGLEKALGVNGNTMPDISEKSTFPVFTTLERLEQLIVAVADASAGNLDVAAEKVKKMIQDAEELKELRLETEGEGSGMNGAPLFTAEQEAKINALYGTLPTIDKLAPFVPLVLEHLRALRLVHTSAFEADMILTELENRQSKQEDEIKKWRTALDVVQNDMKVCEESMKLNMKTVGDWVKVLEERIEKLPTPTHRE